jgi:bifunctional DNase/RNase
MQEMLIYGVSFDLVGKQPIVLLKTADGNKFLPIWIGHPEAAAILMTFYAQITVTQDGTEIEVDSRPSDAIALAIRAEAPIFAADRVIEESAIEFEGEEVDPEQLEAEVARFKHFLDEVTPDQFAEVEGEEEDD